MKYIQPINTCNSASLNPFSISFPKFRIKNFANDVNNVSISGNASWVTFYVSRENILKKAKKIEAGSEVDSRCLKCKDVTNHTIIAMAEDKIAKVECNVCGGRHNYRPAKPESAATAKRKKTRAASVASAKLAKTEARFEELVGGRDSSDAKPYSLTGIYREGDMLDHPTFGLGVITELVLPDKIEVLFRQESRLLICGRLCN